VACISRIERRLLSSVGVEPLLDGGLVRLGEVGVDVAANTVKGGDE
jgi:hypothetical protein